MVAQSDRRTNDATRAGRRTRLSAIELDGVIQDQDFAKRPRDHFLPLVENSGLCINPSTAQAPTSAMVSALTTVSSSAGVSSGYMGKLTTSPETFSVTGSVPSGILKS